jgi:para-nitrobenzyl esterase
MRSFHGLEIPFIFSNTEGGRTGKLIRYIATKKTIKKLSSTMQSAWVNFARYGNPNGKEQETWKPFDTDFRATMIFNKSSTLVNDPDSEQRKVWEGVQYY